MGFFETRWSTSFNCCHCSYHCVVLRCFWRYVLNLGFFTFFKFFSVGWAWKAGRWLDGGCCEFNKSRIVQTNQGSWFFTLIFTPSTNHWSVILFAIVSFLLHTWFQWKFWLCCFCSIASFKLFALLHQCHWVIAQCCLQQKVAVAVENFLWSVSKNKKIQLPSLADLEAFWVQIFSVTMQPAHLARCSKALLPPVNCLWFQFWGFDSIPFALMFTCAHLVVVLLCVLCGCFCLATTPTMPTTASQFWQTIVYTMLLANTL